MLLNFGKIPLLTVELAALERLQNQPISLIFIFDWIFFILAGKKDSYIVSDEFEIGPDSIKDCGVSRP